MTQSLRPVPTLRGFFLNVGALTLAKATLILSQIVVLPIVARYLSLEEFALVAMAMTVVVFANVLSDAGLGRSLVRAERYEEAEWSSVFWFLSVVGLGLALAVVAIAPIWAWFLDQPELVPLLLALSVVPFLQAVSAVPIAEIERRERFSAIARAQIVTIVVSLGAAVGLAVAGFGAWALVAQQILLPLVRLLAIARLTRFRPRARFSWPRVRHHVGFGRDTLGVSLIFAIQSQAAVVAIGRALGEAPLALFAMSDRLSRLPRTGVAGAFSRVIYVRMARVGGDRERLGDLYVASTRMLALLIIPPMAMVAASGDAMFTVLLSEKWAEAATIFALAAPGVALEVATSTGGNVFMASGRTGLRLRMVTERTVLWIATLSVAVQFGVEAVALARSVWVVACMPRYWSYVGRCADLDRRRCLAAIGPPTLVAAAFWALHATLAAELQLSHLEEIVLAAVEIGLAMGLAAALMRKSLIWDLGRLRAWDPAAAAAEPVQG